MPVSIRLSGDLDQRLDFLARQTERTKPFYIRAELLDKIDDLEDYYLAADVLERICKGEETTHPAATVRKDLGLDGCVFPYRLVAIKKAGSPDGATSP